MEKNIKSNGTEINFEKLENFLSKEFPIRNWNNEIVEFHITVYYTGTYYSRAPHDFFSIRVKCINGMIFKSFTKKTLNKIINKNLLELIETNEELANQLINAQYQLYINENH